MKILFLGDYSNLHACIGAELRRRGHHVTVVSDRGSYMDTPADIFLERKPGIRGAFGYLYRLFDLLPRLKGYDAVQLISTNFVNLRPGRIRYIFDRLRSQNGRMFLTLAGNDYHFVRECDRGEMFRFSEFKVGDRPTEFALRYPERFAGWINDENRRLSEYMVPLLDGAVSVLPEYDMAMRPVMGGKVTFANLPVDLAQLPFEPLHTEGPLRILIGMRQGMEVQKGTARLLELCKRLQRAIPGRVQVDCVRNLPLRDYLGHMSRAHIVLDQRYSYSPATNALQAMAMGKVTGSGGQPEYYDYIGEPDLRPVFCLSPLESDDAVLERLHGWAMDPSPLADMGRQGRIIVERHNDVRVVADKWEGALLNG